MTDTPSLPTSRRLPQKAQPDAASALTAGPPSVAETLKRLRRHKSLSLEELAQMSGVSRSMLSQIERDATNPTVATLWRITAALGVSIDEVLGVTPHGVDLEVVPGHALPLIGSAVQWAREGVATGASGRNWAAYGSDVDWPADAPEWQRTLCTDPQTSGGLLVSCAASAAPAVLQAFQSSGFAQAAVVGRMQACEPDRGSRLAFA